jgi:hypothetical protein
MKKKTTKAPTAIHGVTYVPRLTKDQIEAQFLAKVKKPKEGANDILSTFIRVADEVLQAFPTFTQTDFFCQAKKYALGDIRNTQALFQTWVTTLIECCRLEMINGCYSEPIYVVR